MPIKDNNSDPSRARLIGKILLLVAGLFLLLNLLSSLLFGPSITKVSYSMFKKKGLSLLPFPCLEETGSPIFWGG